MSKPHELCYVIVPGAAPGKRIGIVKRGVKGFYRCDFDQPQYTSAQIDAHVAFLNKKLGVCPEETEAMLIGSMFGWDVPGARFPR
jgi:hypothetical protein